MNALMLLAQAVFDNQARTQAQNFRDAGIRAAETGRRMAIAGVFFALGGAFFFTAILVSLIDLGLQIDRGHGVVFSGLMIAATLLTLIGAVAVFGGWLCGRDPKTVMPPPTAPAPHAGELRPLLEAVAVSLLKEFLENQSRRHAPSNPSPAATNPVTPAETPT